MEGTEVAASVSSTAVEGFLQGTEEVASRISDSANDAAEALIGSGRDANPPSSPNTIPVPLTKQEKDLKVL